MVATEQQIDAAIRGALAETRAQMRAIYLLGYKAGVETTTAKLAAFMSSGDFEAPPAPVTSKPAKPRGRSAYAYGAVTGVIRHIILMHNVEGVSTRDIRTRAREGYNLEISEMSLRESIKRLSRNGEIINTNKVWRTGPKFRSDLAQAEVVNENGAPEGAPDADEAVTSSTDAQPAFRLVG